MGSHVAQMSRVQFSAGTYMFTKAKTCLNKWGSALFSSSVLITSIMLQLAFSNQALQQHGLMFCVLLFCIRDGLSSSSRKVWR